jgi:FG-GAP repeat.
VNAQAFVYQNNSRQQNQQQYISFALQGKGKNTFAVGSSIQVFQGDQIISREIIPSRGFQSSIDYKAVIGLGNKAADSVHIIWPDKTFTRIIQPAANRTHHITWPDDAPAYIPPARKLPPPVLQAVATNFDKHQEDNYVDFYIERNMPIMQSKEGPRAAVADVNGDGKQDVYIGGAAGQAGQLYINNGSGFTKSKQPAFELMVQFEDVATLYFDADKDGDQDLMVGSGGNHLQAGIREMQNRLYLNDGKGNFTLKADALPPNDGNTSSIVVLDVDNDNNPDVFVGSKCAPQNVGAPTRHYLLRNTGNATFTDVTTELLSAGSYSWVFVSAASVGDINGDGKPELITVGEFSSVNAFSFTNGKASVVSTGLEQQFGYWQSMAIADVDGDKDLDLVLGNMGENGYLKPSASAPMKLWFGDFDNNQLYDKILTRTVNGKDVPVFLKRDLTDQMPSLKKQNLRFEAFASKSIQELFSPEQLAKGKQYTCNYAQSAVAINNGSGKFALQALPMQVQLSSVHAICVSDVNGDSFPDIIMGGNQYATMPQFGRFDASFGHVLINNGKGAFTWIEPAISGIQIRGAIKDIQPIAGKTMQYLVLRNNDTPVMIQRNNKPDKKLTCYDEGSFFTCIIDGIADNIAGLQKQTARNYSNPIVVYTPYYR